MESFQNLSESHSISSSTFFVKRVTAGCVPDAEQRFNLFLLNPSSPQVVQKLEQFLLVAAAGPVVAGQSEEKLLLPVWSTEPV